MQREISAWGFILFLDHSYFDQLQLNIYFGRGPRHHGGKYYEEAVYGSDDGSTDGSDTGRLWFVRGSDRDDGCGDEGGDQRSCS